MALRDRETDWIGRAAMFIIFGTLLALVVDVYLESPPASYSLSVSGAIAAGIAILAVLVRRKI